MASIDEIIQREINPFESLNLCQTNFWQERQDQAFNVDSIHQEIVAKVEAVLNEVAGERRPKTLMLEGDSGSGKSYLLGRLKQLFNPKAFFVYIDPWPDSNYIWRHLLRQTVDCLMKVPDGQKESQLLLWLKRLVPKNKTLLQELLGERKVFVNNLKISFPSGIYQPNDFFSALYHLLNPKLRSLACEWLRGDDLDEEDLQSLRIKRTIDSENAAQKMMTNLGRISVSSLPIVLCFDNLDNIPRIPDGSIDLQALFNVNSSIHACFPQKFLIIISIITNTWKHNEKQIQAADKARIDAGILKLKPIDLEQGEALLAARLRSIHHGSENLPQSPIFPLSKQALEEQYGTRKKTLPRKVLEFGRSSYQEYKKSLLKEPKGRGDRDDNSLLASFNLVWQDKCNNAKEKITKITQLSGPQLVKNLQEALAALKVTEIQEQLLDGKFAAYSFSFQHPASKEKIGLLWTEEANLTSFCAAMKACQAVLNKKRCQVLYLIRNAGLGKATGYQIYAKIFSKSQNHHLKTTLESIHYLAIYHNLVNAAMANELVVEGRTINLPQLQSLTRESEILHGCSLLQELGIVTSSEVKEELKAMEEFLFNLIKTQSFMSRKTLLDNVSRQFSGSDRSKINLLIQELFEQKKVKIINPKSKFEEQLVCYVPHGS